MSRTINTKIEKFRIVTPLMNKNYKNLYLNRKKKTLFNISVINFKVAHLDGTALKRDDAIINVAFICWGEIGEKLKWLQ